MKSKFTPGLIIKYFSNSIKPNLASNSLNKKSGFPESLTKYKKLIESSKPITEELFPRRLESPEQLSTYLRKEEVSPNLQIKGQIPVESTNAGIFSPVWDLLDRGGKQWRPILGLIMADYFKLKIENIQDKEGKLLYRLLALTELIHNASLIIDDVEDKSEFRRNQPCVHLKFGEDIAINAGVTLLYLPIYKITKEIDDLNLKNKITEAYFEEMVSIQIGQGWDIEMKVKNRIPSVDNYIATVMCKTGVCPRLMVKLIKIMADVNIKDQKLIPLYSTLFKEFVEVIDNLSIAFQIRDDVLNITPSVLSEGKGFLGEDIYEGKLTLMVLHTLNSNSLNSKKEKLREILMMKTKNQELIHEAIGILEKNGSIDYANQIMNAHLEEATNKCQEFAEKDRKLFNSEVAYDIITLMNYLINRNV
jgi:geranylgeranyl pyrophosphate synthase